MFALLEALERGPESCARQVSARTIKTGVACALRMFKESELDLSKLSVDELRQMKALYEKAEVGGPTLARS